jgi:hypothetical protein
MTHFDIVLIDDLRSFKNPVMAHVLRTEKDGFEWLESLSSEDTVGELWLDHDLGEDESGNVTSIMSIVNKLEERAYFETAPQIDMIYIHTSNSVGGRSMEAALQRFFRTRKIYAGDHFTTTEEDTLF